MPTADALANPSPLLAILDAAHRERPLDLIAGPSGYGLPLTAARDTTDADITLACLAPEGEPGGIGGLRALMRLLARSALPVVFTPGVVHLGTVPAHRKINRVDMGTADKVCAAALAIHEAARAAATTPRVVSFVMLELGGAFSAAVAVDRGRIVDGLGGTSGPIGMRAAGALDGEVAFLARSISKDLLFRGGVASMIGSPAAADAQMADQTTSEGRLAREAYVESVVKAVAVLHTSVPAARRVVLSGRMARLDSLRTAIAERLAPAVPGVIVEPLAGFASTAKHAAQGAALIADGLAGGESAALVEAMQLRQATGTVLDHLYLISPEQARLRLRSTE
jgi:predicted butyrate kinase (DUF1464 family)